MSGTACAELAAHWSAAGVRHAVLLRVLPALRHDLATPISVVRMTALLLQRKFEAFPIDAAYCSERVAALDQQTDALTEVLRLLLGWGIGPVDADVSRPALVASCVRLLRPMWATRGMQIEVDPVLEPAALAASDVAPERDLEPRWPGETALRYLLLGALCHLYDTATGAACIRIEPESADTLRLQRIRRFSNGSPCEGNMAELSGEQRVPIDSAALECLAADLGHEIECGENHVRLRLAHSSEHARLAMGFGAG